MGTAHRPVASDEGHMTHNEYVIAAYAAFAIVWLGLIIDTYLRTKRGKHD